MKTLLRRLSMKAYKRNNGIYLPLVWGSSDLWSDKLHLKEAVLVNEKETPLRIHGRTRQSGPEMFWDEGVILPEVPDLPFTIRYRVTGTKWTIEGAPYGLRGEKVDEWREVEIDRLEVV
jgi:hypothetical protein